MFFYLLLKSQFLSGFCSWHITIITGHTFTRKYHLFFKLSNSTCMLIFPNAYLQHSLSRCLDSLSQSLLTIFNTIFRTEHIIVTFRIGFLTCNLYLLYSEHLNHSSLETESFLNFFSPDPTDQVPLLNLYYSQFSSTLVLFSVYLPTPYIHTTKDFTDSKVLVYLSNFTSVTSPSVIISCNDPPHHHFQLHACAMLLFTKELLSTFFLFFWKSNHSLITQLSLSILQITILLGFLQRPPCHSITLFCSFQIRRRKTIFPSKQFIKL